MRACVRACMRRPTHTERFPYMRRFRKSKPTPKIGVVPLLIGTMTFISIVQYLIAFYNRKSQIVNVSKRPEVRKKVSAACQDSRREGGGLFEACVCVCVSRCG